MVVFSGWWLSSSNVQMGAFTVVGYLLYRFSQSQSTCSEHLHLHLHSSQLWIEKKNTFAGNRHICRPVSPPRKKCLWPFCLQEHDMCTQTYTHSSCKNQQRTYTSARFHLLDQVPSWNLLKNGVTWQIADWFCFTNSSVIRSVVPAALPALIRWPIRIFCSLTGEPGVVVYFQIVVSPEFDAKSKPTEGWELFLL